MKKGTERLIKVAINSIDNINTEKKITKPRKKKRDENNCVDISSDKLGRLLKIVNEREISRDIESCLIAEQNNASIKYVKAKINKMQ